MAEKEKSFIEDPLSSLNKDLHEWYLIKEGLELRISQANEVIELLKKLISESTLIKEKIPAKNYRSFNTMNERISPAQIAKIAKEVLLETKRPMKRGELVEAIENKGVLIPGKNKNKNLGTILWRNKDIFNHENKLGYWIKEEIYEEQK